MSDGMKVIVIMAAIVAPILLLSVVLDYVGCGSRWVDSGRKHDWSLMGGCRVEDKQGRLIPEKNVRDMQ